MGDEQLHGSIFLSHTGKDTTGRTLTAQLYYHLEQQSPNRRVFFDETGIKHGENLRDVIKSAIRHCDVFVAIVTEHYLCNKWPLLELRWAREYDRHVFLALVEVSVDEVKRCVRSDQALEVWKHEALIQAAEVAELEQADPILSAEALCADVLGLFDAKVLEVTLEKTKKLCWINAASLIAGHLLEQYPDAGWPVDRPVLAAGCMDAQDAPLLRGGRALLENLKGRAEKVDFLCTAFQRLAAALSNRTLRQVLRSLCCLVEHDACEPDDVHVALLDELSAVLEDAELLITNACSTVAPKPLLGQVLRRMELERKLDGVLRRLGDFSSWDRADRLRRAVRDLAEAAGSALAGAAPVVAAAGDAAAARHTPQAAVDPWLRREVEDGRLPQRVKDRLSWRPHIPKHLRSEVFQHLDNLVPELAALMEFMPSIGIVGMGGIGKTTIARALLAIVQEHFNKVVFVPVGQQLNRKKVLASMWKQLFGEAPRPMPLPELREQLIRKLDGMRVLLVLDDVWTAEALTYLNFVHMLSGSDNRVIVTSRVRSIFDANDQWHIVQPPALRPEHAQELLCWHAFNARQPAEGYAEVVRGIVRECQGLPLMLEVTGASLKGADVAGWRARLQQLEAAEGSDDDVHEQLRERVKRSTDVLPPLTKRCFLLLSMWPEDAALHRQELVALFEYMCPFQARTTSEWAEEQVDALHAKCIITDTSSDASSFTMHDILQDVAVQESGEGFPLLDSAAPDTSRHVCTPARVVRVLRQQARELRLEAPSARWLEVKASTCEKVAGVGTCKHLRLLRLRKCQLRELHDVGAGVLLLRVLELLYCTQLQSLPNAVGSMVHLQRISLDGCAALQCLPASIGCLRNLQHLSLRGCKALTGVPQTVGGLRQLTALLLAECYSLVEVPDCVAGLFELRELDLRSCQSLTALPPQLQALTNLRQLDVRLCTEPVVAQANRLMPSLGEHKTLYEVLGWLRRTTQYTDGYFEPEVFARALVHLQTVPAARVIVPGGRGEGKSELVDHLFDYFHKVDVEFGSLAFPDGLVLLRMQSANGAASSNGRVPQAWVHEQLWAVHWAIFTRIKRHSHDGPLWRNIAHQRDTAGGTHGGTSVHEAVAAVKQCIRALLAGRRLLLLIDDAGPLLQHLFGVGGAIPPSFPGACLATAPHPPPLARLPAAAAVLPMRTGQAACEHIFEHAAYDDYDQIELMDEYRVVGAGVIERLEYHPHAVKLLGRLLSLLEWETALEALDAADTDEAVAPLQLAYRAVLSALTSRHGAASGHLQAALQRFPADTRVPLLAVDAVCRAGAGKQMMTALSEVLNDFAFVREGPRLVNQIHRDVLLPEGCLHMDKCLLDAIAAGPTAGWAPGQLAREDLPAECASNPSDELVAACVLGLLGDCGHSSSARESLEAVPAEEGQWNLDWRAAFDDLDIHPAWLMQLDFRQAAVKQVLVSAATGRVWPQVVAEASQVLSSSGHATLGVLPLLLCEDTAGQVLWQAHHTDALLAAVRGQSVFDEDVVVKLCLALAAREASAPAAIRIIQTYVQLQHTRGYTVNCMQGLPDCQLLCQLRGGQFAQVLLEASRAAEGPVLAHTMGAAALGLRRHGAAVAHLQAAHDAFQREYGPHHAGSLESGASLACAQLGVGNCDAALRGFQQVQDATSRTLGPRHPSAFMAQADGALALKGMGRLRDALQVELTALRGLQQQVGSQDLHTLRVMLRCSDTERELGSEQAAFQRCKWVLCTTLLHVLPEDTGWARELKTSRELLQCKRLACSGLAAGGCVAEALEAQRLVLRAHRSVLGEGHRQTLHLMRDIGCSLAQLGRNAEPGAAYGWHAGAVRLQFMALKLCRERYGQADPDALQSMRLLTDSLLEMGQLREAAAVVAAAQPMVAAEFKPGSAEAAWWQCQEERIAVAPERAERQLVPTRCLMQVLTHEAVAYDEHADSLVLQEGHAPTLLTSLPEDVELLGSPAPTRLGAVVGARITREATCDIPLVVSQLLALQCLDLSGVHLGAKGAQQLSYELVKLSALTGLHCISNRLGASGIGFICKVLPSLQRLRELHVNWNDLGPRGAASLALVLPSMTCVSALDIGRNSVGDVGAAALADSLTRMRQLLLLRLGYNGIGANGMAALAPSIKGLTNLQELDVSFNDLGSDGAAVLGRTLPALPTLTTLSLESTRLDAAGMCSLAPGLKAATKLRKLNLNRHKMGAEGAQALATALPALTALTHLHVEANLMRSVGMGAEGMKHVGPQLKKLRLLAHLNLAWNAMGTEGARALADAMPSLTALTFIDLSLNRLQSDGAAVLGPALAYLSRLKELRLKDFRLNEAAFEPVARAVATLPALVRLEVLP